MKIFLHDISFDVSSRLVALTCYKSVVLDALSSSCSPDERYHFRKVLSMYNDEIAFLTSISERLNKIIDGGKDHKE